MKKLKGRFIVLDSGEGAGKTSLLNRVQKMFSEQLLVLTREPGGSPYAEEIRKLILGSSAAQADAKTLFGLFWAARADHLKNTIIPALEEGKIVISDRFDSSTFAYQIVAQGARELERFFWQTRDFYLAETKPDLYIYLDLDPRIGLERKKTQAVDERNHFEARPIEFHDKLRAGFKEFIFRMPHEMINADQPKEEVFNDFMAVLSKQLHLIE